jgi:phage minor structural protein
MIFILNTNEQVVGTLSEMTGSNLATPYFNDEFIIDLSTGAEVFKFDTLANTPQAKHLLNGNYVAFSHKGEYKYFQIINIGEVHREDFVKTVYCEMAGIELLNEQIRPFNMPSANIDQFLTQILQDSEWKIGKKSLAVSNTLSIDVKEITNAYALLQTYAIGQFGAEISFRVDIRGGKVVAKYVDYYLQRGSFDGFRFAYGKNVEGIEKTVDSSELVTALIGVGKDGLDFKTVSATDKPLNQDFIADEDSYKRWNRKGNHILGVYTNSNVTSPQELLKLTREELQKRKEPKIKYELKTALLGQEDIEIGDTVYVVDHEFTPPLYLSARVSRLTISKTDPNKNECVLANFKEVVSKINDDVRSVAQELIDGKFPIGSGDIQNGAVDGDKIADGAVDTVHIVRDSITTELLQAGSVEADKIKASAIQTQHLSANSIKAQHIDVNQIDATHIKADSIDATHIKAGSINASEINAGAINSTHINANQIIASHIAADQIDATHIKANAITASEINTDAVTAGKIQAGAVTATKIAADQIDASHIKADAITTSELAANSVTAQKIAANSIDASKIVAGSIDTSKLVVADLVNYSRMYENNGYGAGSVVTNNVKFYFSDTTAYGKVYIIKNNPNVFFKLGDKFQFGADVYGTAAFATGVIIRASYTDATYTNMGVAQQFTTALTSTSISLEIPITAMPDPAKTISEITVFVEKANVVGQTIYVANPVLKKKNGGELIVDGTIKANHLAVDIIDASHIKADAITTSELAANSVTAAKIKAGEINASHLVAGSAVITGTAQIGTAVIETANIKDGSITSAKIGSAQVGSINIVDGAISAAKIASATITDAQIANATITSAKISSLDAQKITTGTLDAGKVTISGTNGKLKITNNRMQVFDAQATPKERVSIGDVNGDGSLYGFRVRGADGTTVLYDETGVKTEGITDGAITNPKIGDGTIDSRTLNLDELFVGTSAFIQSLKAVEISADKITTGKISNERLDISGLVSFSAFDNDISRAFEFDPNSNSTYINGSRIATGTITAKQIDTENFVITDGSGFPTFSINPDGNIKLSGEIVSNNFSEIENYQAGYRITKEGDVTFNDAIIRGSVILPNAGVTNHGGNGNVNLMDNTANFTATTGWALSVGSGVTGALSIDTDPKYGKILKATKTADGGSWWVLQGNTLNTVGKKLVIGTAYTLSFMIKNDFPLYVNFMDGNGTNAVITPNYSIPVNSEWTKVVWTFTPTATGNTPVFYLAKTNTTLGNVYISEIKLEVGSTATNWVPSLSETGQQVRFWSGAKYEDRYSAPFIIYQDGSIKATKGTFQGTFTGSVDIGNIHISDTTSTSASFKINNNTETQTIIELTDSKAQFNSDFILGNNVIKYTQSDGKLAMTSQLVATRTNGNSISLNNSGSFIDLVNKDGGSFTIRSNDGYGGLVFVANGSSQTGGTETEYDFKFGTANSDVKVKIEGELEVTDKIRSSSLNKLEIVFVDGTNSGVDYMIK